MDSKIIYTKTDEAPALATQSFLPIVKAFLSTADVKTETKDISLAARVLAHFPEDLNADQKVEDALAELGALTQDPLANIIKLPNISASIPQLKSAIKELQSKGYKVPDFPEEPETDEEKQVKAQYAKVLGSAVNPVLREGNSDRRVAAPVKAYAKANPHKMGDWAQDSESHVATMSKGDFYGSEKSVVMTKDDQICIKFEGASGSEILKKGFPVLKGEVLDSSLMSKELLVQFFEKEINEALEEDVLLSLHLKATMMKVSDPIIFGHAVKVYYKDLFEKYGKLLEDIGVEPNNGIGDVYNKISNLPKEQKDEIEEVIKSCYAKRPRLAMVNSDKGITNLHVPSDVIIDASMPAAIRNSGKMWGPDGSLIDTKALIPDRCYSGIYQEVISFCKKNGAFDVTTMGNVSNVGLMAKKAEEYGSHDKTFEIKSKGRVKVVNLEGEVLMEQEASEGDIFRMCQTKDVAVKDWVGLAVRRAKATKSPAIFWLDPQRAHDANLISKVEVYLKDHDIADLEILIKSPVEAMAYTLEKVKEGQDVISVTGNVLRDYLTDLFPILELGTSAKMLSIVPLLAGGGLFETGAGGSAPKHVQQFQEENHLRWDSLGEFLALAVSIETLAESTKNKKAVVLAQTLDEANGKYLKLNKSPSRKVGELDNRGSHFYLAFYWSEALAKQNKDQGLKEKFEKIYSDLKEHEVKILEELSSVQGKPVDMGGYYFPEEEKVSQAMRPSKTFNAIIDSL